MRSVAVGLFSIVLASCASTVAPGDPVFSGYTRTFRYPVERPFGEMLYTGRQANVPTPIIPVMAFGAAFDVDFVLMGKDSEFDMIELARVSLPSGPTWVALETLTNGEQTLIANLDGLETFVPELPLTRIQRNDLQVTDKSTESTLDVTADYTNSKGQKVHAYFTGTAPTELARHRNGQTFNHSVNQLTAVLDIPASMPLFKADLEIAGEKYEQRSVGGVVPGRFAMEQVMGGFAIASFKVVPTAPGVGSAELGEIVYNPPGTAPTARATPDMLVRMAVQQNNKAINKCWEDRFSAKKDLKGGKMSFELTVAAGDVTAAKAVTLTGADAFVDDALSKCVVATVNEWTMDSAVSGTVGVPLSFVPGDVELDEEARTQIGAVSFTAAPVVVPAAADPAAAPAAMGVTAVAPAPALVFDSFTTVHTAPGGATIEMPWLVSRQGDLVVARQVSDFRTLEYTYRVSRGQYLELVTINVEQYGRATPVASVTFNPPLPDVRWPFNGRKTSTFVVDVNGQQSHAYGEAEAFWTESGPKVKVTPIAPDWVKERPMVTTITYGVDGTADIKIERVGE